MARAVTGKANPVKGNKGKAKAGEPTAGPSSAFNMKINPPGRSKQAAAKNKKNPPGTTVLPKRPAPARGKNAKDVKENKVPEVLSSDVSDSESEEEVPVKRASVQSPSKASPAGRAQNLLNNSTLKVTPKSTPKSASTPKNLPSESDSDEESSDESEPEVRAKPPSSKKAPETVESDSDEEDFKIPSATQKQGSVQPSSGSSHRKNLTKELSKAHAEESSGSESDDSEDSTYESTVEEDEAEDKDGHNKATKVTAKQQPTAVETDQNDLKEGARLLLKMTDDEVNTLLDRLEAACPVLDRKAMKDRAKEIKWDDIAFGSWDGDACRKAWLYLRQKRRVRRNMWEVVHEIKLILDKDVRKFRDQIVTSFPGYPTKPGGVQGGLNMYAHVKYTEKKELNKEKINYIEWYGQIVKEFHAMSPEEKAKWVKKSEKAQQEYQAQLQEFYDSIGYRPPVKQSKKKSKSKSRSPTRVRLEKIKRADLYPDAPTPPGNPLELYIQSKLDNYEVPPEGEELEELKVKYGKKWHALDNSKKSKWIDKVIKNIEEYYSAVGEYKKTHEGFEEPKPLKIASVLTKAELSLWEADQGRPEKPPASHIDMLIEEMEESGELGASLSQDEKKTQAESKFSKMNWPERERLKLNHRNTVVQYVSNIGEYFSSLPEFLRPLLITTVDKKYRHEIAGFTGGDESSPKKRKRKEPAGTAAVGSTTAGTSASSTKAKKAKVETVIMKEVMADVEKIKSNLDSSPEPSPKKKKKRSAVLSEIIRGIFDARQDLGRQYSVYYYYARNVAGNPTWVTTLDLLGIMSTASRILQEFIQLRDHEKSVFINHSRNFHAERYYSLKIEPDSLKTSDREDEFFLEFQGEPKFPPSTPEAFYTAEMKKANPKTKPSWKNLSEDAKMFYTKKLYKATKRYVLDYERFVDQMTPNDLIEYAVSRLKTENHHLKTRTSHPDFVNRDFIFPLPQHCIPDEEDFEAEMVVSEELKHKEELDKKNKSIVRSKPKGIFNQSRFLEAVSETLEKSSHQNSEVVEIDSDVSQSQQSPIENPWADTPDEIMEAMKAAKIRRKAEELYNLGDLTSAPFQEELFDSS